MEKFGKLKYIILLWIFLTISIIPTFAHHGSLIMDCGREVYYPTQILLGKILYKDIFNIYGPFSYMFNAFLFKLLGIHLNILYASGIACAFLTTSLTYLIARKFLPEFLSFSIAFFTISIGILNINLFNLIFPYSFAMIYGLVAFLISVFFILEYQEKNESTYLLYISSFFGGICVANKYEFLPYLVVLIYAIIKTKPLNLKQYYFTILSLLFAPIFCFGTLFLQGLKIEDLAQTASTIKAMAQSQSLKYLYLSQGVYFNKLTIPYVLINALKTLIPLIMFLFSLKIKNKFLKFITTILSTILILILLSPASLLFVPITTVVLFIMNFKKVIINPQLLILTLSGFLICLKVFWGLATLNYGVFSIGYLLIALLALIFNIYPEKKPDCKNLGIYIIIISTIFGLGNIASWKYKNFKIKTPRGRIYTETQLGASTNALINYIGNNTKTTDTVVILPEGTFINFLTNRKSDNYYNSMIPLYVESIGENNLIKHFKKTKPQYIIFNNWDTSKDYYYKNICNDYASSFCSVVAQNYTLDKIIDNQFRYLIYKKKPNY